MADKQHARAMTLADARDAVRTQLSPVLEQQAVTLARAHGPVLAADLIANVDLPPYDNSAVDGYAVSSEDLVPDRAVTLRLAGEAAAGHPFEGVIEAGETVRILTGAPLPRGADRVVMQEACLNEGDTVGVRAHAYTKKHWRRRGEDVSIGSRILLSGQLASTGPRPGRCARLQGAHCAQTVAGGAVLHR